jgi:hypothetical protein
MVRCEHDLIRIRSSARGQTDHDPGRTSRPVGGTQGRERFGESFDGASRGLELEDKEERDPNHAIYASYTTHETDARKAEKPTNNTPSKSAA